MLNFDVKKKINTLRDILVGKVPDPKAQVEQITIALIYKFMDDMDLQGAEFGGARVFFSGDYKDYAFSQIMLPEHSAQDRLNLYAEGIDKMTNNPDLPKLFRDILRNAYIPYRDPETLNRFLKEIAEFSYEDSEDLGNAFEYLLSIMGSQGDAGQFRTPRHIIDMMVEITAPAKNESILDPACGTAGFLISAYNYIKKSNLDEHGKSTLVADDMTRMTKNFTGYDISPDMVRLSRVNMYLHGFTSPNISEYDTLTSLEKWDDNFDVIFSNPPFMTPKGGITPHNRYRVSAKRAEVLFVDYIAEHLNPTGRAAIIVPEGIVFQSQTAYKNLRKMLVEGNYLYGVISLPAGVFNPYSGVKTSILLIDKTLAKERDSILFVKLNNDGFDLGAQRREIKGNEIPDVVNIFKDYQQGVDVAGRENVVLAKKVDIAGQDYILVGERYAKTIERSGAFPLVSLGDTSIFRIESGGTPDTKNADYWDGNICWATLIDLPPDNTITYLYDTERHITEAGLYGSSAKLLPADSILVSSRATIGRIAITRCETATNQGFKNVIITDKSRALTKYVAFMLTKLVPKMVALSAGGTFKEISKTNFSTLQIPLPPLAVQEEIVTEIESYQKIIDGARQVVENYKPTIMIDPTWEIAKLGDVFKLSSGRGLPSKDRENGEFNVYGGNGITGHHKEYFVEDPTIVIGRVGEYCGATHITSPKCWVTDNALMATDFYVDIDLIYLWAMLNNLNLRQYAKVGGQPSISQTTVYERSIPLPPIEIQRSIVGRMKEEMSIVDQNKRLIEIFQQKIKDKIAEVWGDEMSTDNIIQNISGALSLLADRTSAILQRNDSPPLNADEIVEEYVHKLRFYLPVDFGNTENNEYMDYLAQSCCENYRNGKYQFSLMAYHMLFMAVLYKEFWGLKCFSNERVAALCRRNGTYNAIEQVFDASPIPEKSFIDDFFGVFSWHPNRKSTYKEYVDKRDRCAHNSGFVQYGKEDVESYFADVLRNIERVSQACEESLVEVYSNTLKRYLESPSFESTTTIDFISRELSEKKYSYRDLSKLLAVGRPEGMDSLSYTLSFCFSRLFLSLTVENAGYSPENGSDDLIEELCSFWRSLTPEDQETLSLQLEYEIEMLDEKGYSISELRKLIENTDEQQ